MSPLWLCYLNEIELGRSRYADYLQKYFKRKIRGMWIPERVWEQNLTKTFADANMEYTVLDDSHFKYAGLEDYQLTGYYVTEDQGRTLKVFPASELLRYYIPFEEPAKCIEYFKSCATEGGDVTIVYADDGESLEYGQKRMTMYTKMAGWKGLSIYC